MGVRIDDIAADIKAARVEAALTQRELGERVGLPQSHISKIESGAVDLQLSSLIEIARALGLELKLVPRKTLPAIDGVIRSHQERSDTSRALAIIAEGNQIAEKLRDAYPDVESVSAFQKALRTLDASQLSPASLRNLQRSFKQLEQIQKSIQIEDPSFNGQPSAQKFAKEFQKALTSVKEVKNAQPGQGLTKATPRPAYRLEGDGA